MCCILILLVLLLMVRLMISVVWVKEDMGVIFLVLVFILDNGIRKILCLVRVWF